MVDTGRIPLLRTSPPLSGRSMLSSGGASLPPGGTASTVDMHMSCFNIGIHQAMLGSEKHLVNARRILGKDSEEGELDLLGLCEDGGHKQGLKAAGIHPEDFIDEALPAKEYRAAARQAYMSAWHAAGAAQPSVVPLQLWERPACVALAAPALGPQLVLPGPPGANAPEELATRPACG